MVLLIQLLRTKDLERAPLFNDALYELAPLCSIRLNDLADQLQEIAHQRPVDAVLVRAECELPQQIAKP